jgi:carbon storage regulator
MLMLTRKTGEAIEIGTGVTVRVMEVRGQQVRLGVEAPASISVHRLEVAERIRAEQPAPEGAQQRLTAVNL